MRLVEIILSFNLRNLIQWPLSSSPDLANFLIALHCSCLSALFKFWVASELKFGKFGVGLQIDLSEIKLFVSEAKQRTAFVLLSGSCLSVHTNSLIRLDGQADEQINKWTIQR